MYNTAEVFRSNGGKTATGEIQEYRGKSYHRTGAAFDCQEAFMRTIALVSISLAALSISTIGAHGEGSWCATYGGNGGTNCGFYSSQQCMAAISGNGGFCSQNGFYGTAREPRRRR
jgi:hypothetical protein